MVFLVGIIWILTRMTMRRQQKIFGDGSIRLNEDDDTTYFEDEVKLSQITFDDVSYNVSKLRVPSLIVERQTWSSFSSMFVVDGKKILTSVTGYLEPGNLLAIMGPSGAGKSSLLVSTAYHNLSFIEANFCNIGYSGEKTEARCY
jgi:ABC-type multidrug transport system ATPase subunit